MSTPETPQSPPTAEAAPQPAPEHAPPQVQWVTPDQAPDDTALLCRWNTGAQAWAWRVGPQGRHIAPEAEIGMWLDAQTGAVLEAPDQCALQQDDVDPQEAIADYEQALRLSKRSISALLGRMQSAQRIVQALRFAEGHTPEWAAELQRLLSEPLDDSEGEWPGPEQWEALDTLRQEGFTIVVGLLPREQTYVDEFGRPVPYSIDLRDEQGQSVHGVKSTTLFDGIEDVLEAVETVFRGEEPSEEDKAGGDNSGEL